MHSATPHPVKLFSAILFREADLLEQALAGLQARLSPVDLRFDPVPFDLTSYYEPELGPGLSRVLVSCAELVPPERLVDAKWAARDIEAGLARDGQRRVNVDVGALDLFKVLLASCKERGNKVYLGRGVWADLTLYFERGRLHPLPWSFPDFRAGRYDAALLQMRQRYKEQLRELPFGREEA